MTENQYLRANRIFDEAIESAHAKIKIPAGHLVDIQSVASVPVLKAMLPTTMKKDCYNNVMRQVMDLTTMYGSSCTRYVLGRTFPNDIPIPLDHAFLWFDDQYYDLTLERYCDLNGAYISKIEFGDEALREWATEHSYAPMMTHFITQQIDRGG